MNGHRAGRVPVGLAAAALALAGCGPAFPAQPAGPPQPAPAPSQEGRTITLGETTPTQVARRFPAYQPLAAYLQQQLAGHGVGRVRLEFPADLAETTRLFREGGIDVMFDTPFPVLAMQEAVGGEIVLRYSKKGSVTYQGLVVTQTQGGVRPQELGGKVVALKDATSTSGFLQPAAALLAQGFTLRQVAGPDSPVGPAEVGYLFSGDEENSVEMLLRGRVAAAGLSEEFYQKLRPELRGKIAVLMTSQQLPRALVLVRPGLDPELTRRITEALQGLAEAPEGQEVLQAFSSTERFDPLSPEQQAALEGFRSVVRELAALGLPHP